MVKNINPFIVSGKIPAEYFCDRTAESATLEKSLSNQLNVVLTSPRRVGKTSLIDFTFDRPTMKEKFVIISVDILHTSTFREFILVLGTAVFEQLATRSNRLRKQFVTILKSLSASFGYDPVQNTPTFNIRLGDIQLPEYTMKEIFEYLESVSKRCVVIIDEFQQITRYPEKNVEALLRTHVQKMSNVNFVFSGSQRRLMEEMFFSAKRPFYQSAKPLRLAPIPLAIYKDFATHLFQQAGKGLQEEAFEHVYEAFRGVTFYVQRLMKDAYSETPVGETCDVEAVRQLIGDYIDENDSRMREQLSFISEAQKELLYAIHEDREAQGITSAAFTKKHRLRSPSATQSAALKLLEYDMITRNEKTYSLSDPLMILWLDRRRN